MAHITKFKLSQMGQIFAHINREDNQVRKYGNADINTSLSYMNMDLKHGEIDDLTSRIESISHQKRKDLVACCGVVITLPRELHDSELAEQNRFFYHCFEFIKQKFGEKNIIYATVHHDETTPHIHIGFVPVTQKERKFRSKARKGETYTQERVSAKEVITRTMLNSFHTELDNYITEKFGQKVSILTGELKNRKNISINELKQRTADELKAKQELIHSIDDDIETKPTLFNRMIVKKEDYLSLKTENLLLKNKLAKENEDLNAKNKKINAKERDLQFREMNYLSKKDAKPIIEELKRENEELLNKNKDLSLELFRKKSDYLKVYEENSKLKEENKKLNEFKDLAMKVVQYSLKVVENLRSHDFNSHALYSSLNKILDFCKVKNISISSRSRSR